MTDDIALTGSQRSVLLSLQRTQTLASRTQERLSTGRKINSVIDDSIVYFRAKSLTDVATDFNNLRSDIDQGISALQVFSSALDSIEKLTNQLRGLAEQQRTTTSAVRKSSTLQFKTIGKQIFELIEDANFNGVNLLAVTTAELDIRFGTRTTSRIQVGGLALNSTQIPAAAGSATQVAATNAIFTGSGNIAFSSGGGFVFSALFTALAVGASNAAVARGFSAIGDNNSRLAELEIGIVHLERAVKRIRGHATYIGNSAAILTVRLEYTDRYVSQLTTASDKLTLADLNEEGANLVALQTRQQLSIQSLAFSGQALRSIITLLQ